MARKQEYGNESITSLKGADRVRKRPAVIFGSDGVEGCAHSIFEIVSNSIDEARDGHGDTINVTRCKDGSVIVEDFGRGMPVDWNNGEGRYNWELLFCEMYAGGKYGEGEDNYEFSLGLNGLGLCATQYASAWMTADIYRDGFHYHLDFKKGENVGGLQKEPYKGRRTGSIIHWKPDDEVFTDIDVPGSYYKDVLRRQAVVNAGLTLNFTDEKEKDPATGKPWKESWCYQNGIADYVQEVAGEDTLTPVFSCESEASGRDREDQPDYKVRMSAAFCFSNKVQLLEYYHNSSWLEHGGSPEHAVRTAFVYQINKYLKDKNLYKKGESAISFQDVQDCLVYVSSSFSTRTSYENQTKKAITNKFVQEAMTEFLRSNLEIYFIENPFDAEKIGEQVLLNKRSREKAEEVAWADIQRDMEQGFQGWEYKFNSVSSSRGDYPFITMTAGTGKSRFAKMATITMLDVRRKGQGKDGHKKPVLFPKLVFLYDENLHGPGKELEDVFEAGIRCSSKTMYPDWLSLTGEGYIASMYKKYGRIISPMGCRAFLSPWYEKGGMEPADETDVPRFVGRFNVGVVSLHLPMILAKARQESRDFYEVLDYYLELIRKIHIRTYAYLGEMRASTNPLAYCEGGFYGGHLGLHDKIKPLLKTATASFGITAFNELQELYNGKSLVEDGQFALEVLEHINEKVNQFKKEDGNLYAIYATPAENLCGLQVKQFRKKYGIIENVSDREYVSNGFHCHVTEDITPIQKQDLEYRFWELSNGGKIQYVKYPIAYNTDAIRTLVRRAMKMGFYEGVNLSLSYCDDCGHEELNMDVCPKCGSRNLTKIDRMNGYLSYSRVKGDTRLNDAKMAEIAERKSM